MIVVPTSFIIEGDVQKRFTVSATEAKADLPSSWATLTYQIKGKAYTGEGVPLIDLLNLAKLKTKADRKNDALNFVVAVVGTDGYTASFSYSEVASTLGKARIYVLFTENGRALVDKSQPAELASTGDEKFGRYVHGIASIKVRSLRAPFGPKPEPNQHMK